MSAYLLIWLLPVIGIIYVIWRSTSNWRTGPKRFFRRLLRCLAMSLALAPAGFFTPIVGIPAPASFVIAATLVSAAEKHYFDNFDLTHLVVAFGSLLVCWLLFCGVSAVWSTIDEIGNRSKSKN
jgi:hypothetical protein